MKREYYADTIANFLVAPPETILGHLARNNDFTLEQSQRQAWEYEIAELQFLLAPYQGMILFEYAIPRMGRRIDVLLVIGPVIFVLEFKVGAVEYEATAVDQAWDYALDLKNFHETSHEKVIAPILIATQARPRPIAIASTIHHDQLYMPIKCNSEQLATVIRQVLEYTDDDPIDTAEWATGRYRPTPTIIEAAMALYNGHAVADISRSDASAVNLSQTSETISEIISTSRDRRQKAICFVTGVPGAGKTLVGLNIATTHIDKQNDLYSVFLSGNGPLVAILREALARDRVQREKSLGKKIKKHEAMSQVKAFIQNVHHFRDECLIDRNSPPLEHVALFDEAQRAWNIEQTASFMLRKKRIADFQISEPEFLISCLNRHPDWAVIVCLVGGGQEINTGEAGISEWLQAIMRSYPDWQVYISPNLFDTEYSAGSALDEIAQSNEVIYKDELHLSVSMRSFRAEKVSLLVKQLLDLDLDHAQQTLSSVHGNYPIVLTRDISKAKQWLRQQARGSERYGIVVSSQAERLKPHAIDVRSPMDPIHWFLDDKEDIRSSYYLEDVATEFDIQGLELDWACVTWDADFRYSAQGWQNWSFCGKQWRHIQKDARRQYQKNAYRVLLTRARQGMVIVVPFGDESDPTRNPEFYNPTFSFLQRVGFSVI
ncbi:MAG: DUF2075 domain-containing protein [Armatimonadota bacterium]